MCHPNNHGGFLVSQQEGIQMPMQQMWVQPLGQEDPLEKEMATHSSVLAWEMPWTDSDAGRDWGQEEEGTTEDEMADGITD